MLKAIIVGNLVKDVETMTTKSGKAVTKFCVAANTKQKTPEGEKITEFVNVSAFGQIGEVAARYLRKGRKVTITGTIWAEAYMGKDGKARTNMRCFADDIEFMAGKMDSPIDTVEQSAEQAESAYNQAQQMPDGFLQVNEDDLPF